MSQILTDDLDPLTIPQGRGISFAGQLDEETCLEMAERFAFQQVHHVHYDLKIKLISKQCWELRGTIKAKLIQSCSIEFEPPVGTKFSNPKISNNPTKLSFDPEGHNTSLHIVSINHVNR